MLFSTFECEIQQDVAGFVLVRLEHIELYYFSNGCFNLV